MAYYGRNTRWLASVGLAILVAACAGGSASARPIQCEPGYVRQGNRCVKVVTPTPTPTPAPVAPVLSVVDSTAYEDGGTAVVDVSRTGNLDVPVTFNWHTQTQNADPDADYIESSGIGTIAAGSTVGRISFPVIDDLVVEAWEYINVMISVAPDSGVTLAKAMGVVTLQDNDEPQPAPPPSPEPEPVPPQPDVTAALMPAGIPGVNSTDVVGAFRFICGAGQLSYDDPLVYPDQPGRSHLHQYYGNVSANAYSNYTSLRAKGDSTCNWTGLGIAANRSAYWIPAMLDGKGNVVSPDYVQVYYKREPPNSTVCQQNICVGIPDSLRFIAGFDMVAGKQTIKIGEYHCGSKVWKADAEGLSLANNTTCPVGTKVEALINSPKCWDGKNVAVADHRAHLSEMISDASTGWVKKCPTTHPYVIPQFTIGSFYSVNAGDDVSKWTLSSDAMYPNLPRGATLHFDYFEAWDQSVKAMWEQEGCIANKLNCNGGNLGNGSMLKGASQPSYGWINPVHLVPLSSIPH